MLGELYYFCLKSRFYKNKMAVLTWNAKANTLVTAISFIKE